MWKRFYANKYNRWRSNNKNDENNINGGFIV